MTAGAVIAQWAASRRCPSPGSTGTAVSRYTVRLGAVALCWLALAPAAAGDALERVDAAASRLVVPTPAQRVPGTPALVQGDESAGGRWLTLAAQRTTTVYLPAAGGMLLEFDAGPVTASDVRVVMSNGSALARELSPVTVDDRRLRIDNPSALEGQLVHVRARGPDDRRAHILLFGTEVAVQPRAPARRLPVEGAPTRQLHDMTTAEVERFERLGSGDSGQVRLPDRAPVHNVRIDARVPLASRDTLTVAGDLEVVAETADSTQASRSLSVPVSGRLEPTAGPALVGRRERLDLIAADAVRALRLHAGTDLLVQVSARSRPDVLLQRNQPHLVDSEAGAAAVGEDLASRARDNHLEEAPLQVLERLRQGRPVDIAQRAPMISQVRSELVTWRTLLPVAARREPLVNLLAPRPTRLRAPDQHPRVKHVGDHQLGRLVRQRERLPAARLAAGTPLRWALPVTRHATDLRVYLRAPDAGRTRRELELSIDGGAPLPLVLDQGLARPQLVQPDVRAVGEATDGDLELRLPANARRLTLALVDGAPLEVAAEVALPRIWRGSEDVWLDALARTTPIQRSAWLLDLLQDRIAAPDTPAARLQNLWLPLAQEIRELARGMRDGRRLHVANLDCSGAGQGEAPAAFRAASTDQWWQRLAAATAQVRASAGTPCVNAHLEYAEALVHLGEHYLAEDYLRTLVLDSRSAELVASAVRQLDATYDGQQYTLGRARLAAYRLLAEPSPDHLRVLAERLLEHGQDRLAVELALSQDIDFVADVALAAMLRLDWQRLAQRIGGAVDAQSAAGRPGLLERLTPDQRRVWRTADELVTAAAGARWLHDRVQAGWHQRWLVSEDAPLRVQVTGPAYLRFGVRELRTQWPPPEAGWLVQEIDGRRYPLRIAGSAPSERFELVDDDDTRRPGTRVERYITVPEGDHELVFRAHGPDLLFDLQRARRLVPAPRPPLVAVRDGVQVVPQVGLDAHVLENDVVPALPPGPDLATTDALTRPEAAAAICELRPEAARQWLDNVLFDARDGTAPTPARLVSAAELGHCLASRRELAASAAAVAAWSRWQPHEDVVAAGVQLLPVDAAAFLHEGLRARALDLPQPGPGERLLARRRAVGWRLLNVAPAEVRLIARVVSVANTTPAPVSLALQRDGVQLAPLLVNAGGVTRTFELPAGEAVLTVSAGELATGEYVLVRLEERVGGEFRAIADAPMARWWLAAPGAPLTFAIAGPAWVRIDEYLDDGRIRHRYQAVREPMAELRIEADDAVRYVRAWTRRPLADADRSVPVLEEPPAVAYWPGRAHLPPLPGTPSAGLAAAERPPLWREIVGPRTRSIGAALERARSLDEGGRLRPDERLSLDVAWRQQRGEAQHLRTGLGVRLRADDAPTLLADHRRWWRLPRAAWSTIADARLFAQPAGGRLATSLSGSGSLRHQRRLREDLRHSATLTAFARWLSESPGTAASDPDVFTGYKFDHRTGVRIQERLTWQPWLDTEVFGSLSATSNEWRQPGLDRAAAELGWRQLVTPLAFEVRWRHQYFRADDDRRRANHDDRVALALRWHGWPALGRRWFIEARGDVQLQSGRVAGGVRIARHVGRGQALADFHGEELWLDSLLRWRAARAAVAQPIDHRSGTGTP